MAKKEIMTDLWVYECLKKLVCIMIFLHKEVI